MLWLSVFPNFRAFSYFLNFLPILSYFLPFPIEEDMPGELLFIHRYDEAKKAVQNIVDMPDRKINNMLLFLHQNHGAFPKRRREQFRELIDVEIERMQKVYREVFEMDWDKILEENGQSTAFTCAK